MGTVRERLQWVEQKQAELLDMEWDWRQQDEREGLSAGVESLPSLAKREKETEAGRLQAELAVASFIEQFYLARKADIGQELVDEIDVDACNDPSMTRDAMARFVEAEVARLTAPRLATYWGWPSSHGARMPEHWWVELPAVFVQDERTQSWEQYRFHVAGKQIKGWTASPSHTATGTL